MKSYIVLHSHHHENQYQMKNLYVLSGLALLLVYADSRLETDILNDANNTDKGYQLVDAFPNLQFDMPVELTSPADNTDRIFVIAQKGKIHVFTNKGGVKNSSVFLDIEKNVDSGGEKGLLG